MNQTAPSQPEQQALAVLVLTSHEVTLAHQALGKLPAEATEGLRAKIVMQAQNQQQVLDDLQKLIAEQAAPKSVEPASPVSNISEHKNKKAKAKPTATPEPQTEPVAVTEA